MRSSATLRRRVLATLRVVAATVSAVVVATTAFAWYQVQQLDRSTPAAPVTSQAPPHLAAEQNILLVGLDTRTDAQGDPLPAGLLDALHAGSSSDGGDTSDSLIVVHVPAGGGRASAISIPRDSYVDLTDGLGRHKINSAYSRAYRDKLLQLTEGGSGMSRPASPTDPEVVRQASAAGARATVGSVEDLTGLRIDHYAAVNLAGFADLSQAIGGVPVCLRAPAEDSYSGTVMPAGPQTVSGTRALAFVRQRHGLPNGDLDRIARQQAFLAGATGRLLSAGTLTNPFAVSRLSEVISRSVTLDAGWDVVDFAARLQSLQTGSVTFRTIPSGSITMPTPEDGAAVQVSPETVRAFVADVIAADAAAPAANAPGAANAPAAAPGATAPAIAPGATAPAVAPGASGPVAPSPVVSTRSAAPAPPPALRTSPITAAAPGCVN